MELSQQSAAQQLNIKKKYLQRPNCMCCPGNKWHSYKYVWVIQIPMERHLHPTEMKRYRFHTLMLFFLSNSQRSKFLRLF